LTFVPTSGAMLPRINSYRRIANGCESDIVTALKRTEPANESKTTVQIA
jgi:hypothetical protein